ncbi:MAG: quinone-dependent dihydroorotate dehydrogenase [Pseudomonadota bacterium]
MSLIEKTGLRLLHLLEPEAAHEIGLKLLRAGLAGGRGPVQSNRLKTNVAGIDLPNPIGIAAGFDKNAQAVPETLRTGAGFTEIGAVTPRPQFGNPKPRLFRLSSDRAVINRFGFNNCGMEAAYASLTARPVTGIVGVNLGANKDTEDKSNDYMAVLSRFHDIVDFATVNVSSPNTERLRDLQGRAALDMLLGRVLERRDELGSGGIRLPIFLKIAPDLSLDNLSDIADICLKRGIDAVVATNTTLDRRGLRSAGWQEKGGLSGRPLFQRSTEVLKQLYRVSDGRLPLIGVGGISSGEDAYAKIRAGASAVQMYSALVYEGVSHTSRVAKDLRKILARDGYASVAGAIGVDA